MKRIDAEHEPEQLDHREGFLSTLMSSVQEHFNPIVQVLSSWRLYRELQQHQAEIRSLQQEGRRVPNRLHRSKERRHNRRRPIDWSIVISLIIACWLLIPIWLQFYASSKAAPPPYNAFAPDVLIAFLALSLCPALWVLLLIIFNPRWVRLWHISMARRHMAQKVSKTPKPFFSSRSAPRRFALLLGLMMYLALLLPALHAIGIGAMPHFIAIVSAAVGHARALPIVLFPIFAEILTGLHRRGPRRRQRLDNAGLGSLSLSTTL